MRRRYDAAVTASGAPAAAGGVGEVFGAFLRLGLTSFGGPIAHLGYFRTEFVDRRRWVDDRGYGELVALSQFLPGPSSSQVGFGLGLLRAGPLGAVAAFTAFTLPSAILLVLFAFGVAWFDGPIAAGALAGLKVVAVAIVAQAVIGMARTLTPDLRRALVAVAALVIVVAFAGPLGQVGAIVVGAIAGMLLCRSSVDSGDDALRLSIPRWGGVVAFAVLAALIAGLPVLAAVARSPVVALLDSFVRAGALVFGGGHVVLPLLEAEVVSTGLVGPDRFLAGYSAAQAVPGPLFTFAGYLGALAVPGPGGVAGAALALVAIFVPGFLILLGVLPFWHTLRTRPVAQGFIRGASAAVVGVLAAALYDPVFTSAIADPSTFALAVACFVLLVVAKAPPWSVVLLGAAAGILFNLVG
jgi:chromate transporter